jgi:hypothetical protein
MKYHRKESMPMTNVIVEVYGGVVQNIAANKRNVRVVVIDWDNAECMPAEKYTPALELPSNVKSLTPQTRRLYKQAAGR